MFIEVKQMNKIKTFSIRLSDDLRNLVKRDAEQNERSENYIINSILKKHYELARD